MKKMIFLAVLALGISGTVAAQDVFNWRDSRGVSTYSDVPRNMTPAGTNIVNVRTQTSAPAIKPEAVPNDVGTAQQQGSLADQQAALSQKLAEQNKAVEEENKKIAEQNRLNAETTKQENCKRARLNRAAADSARSNQAELIQRYDADIRQYCN
ncbi:hypothetical protein L1281_000309 [Neisseria sp. HSC-16F19]|nr:DUF4124 domain-containing protein [Neisseria sp. HSC-16F19]MCP2039739.1 hypothetical protein [Neisseria sp. HSC-16F19]